MYVKMYFVHVKMYFVCIMTISPLTVPGTIMMSGCGILTNGKGTRREYGEFNLDELNVSIDIEGKYHNVFDFSFSMND